MTKKQQKIYDFIQVYQAKNNIQPTLKVIATEFKISIPTVHQYLTTMKNNNINPFINSTTNMKTKYSIGIIGYGIVGQAVEYGFHDYEIHLYDKFKQTETLEEVVKKSEFIFICLPTPIKSDESGIDLSIIDDNIANIVKYTDNTDKIIVIKSTVVPGTTEAYAKKYPNSIFSFNPEFLREASFLQDFVTADRVVIGSSTDSVFRRLSALYQSVMPTVPIFYTDATSAEMVKYMANCYLATKVIFANEMYDICQSLGIKYEEVKKMVVSDKRIVDTHLDITTVRGFGGKCFPKDLLALRAMAKGRKIDTSILDTVWKKNLSIRTVRDWDEIPFAVTKQPIIST